MLFLLNDEVLDIGLPHEVLEARGLGAGLSAGGVMAFGRQTAFATMGLDKASPDERRGLAAMIATVTDANCALFVVPANALGPGDVAAALARAPLQTLVRLDSHQTAGRLAAGLVNAHVWSLVPRVDAA